MTPAELLKNNPPMSGRYIAENGDVHNILDLMLQTDANISRGLATGYRAFNSYGARTSVGAETNQPIWPNGAIKIAGYGSALMIQSTDPADAAAGAGVQQIEIHYLRQDLSEVTTLIDLNGTTPVALNDPEFRFMQCMHVNRWGASGPYATGSITATIDADIYSIISVGSLRCSSAFRMVPGGYRWVITGAIGSSISGTSAARTLLDLVATELFQHSYVDPVALVQHAGIGVQDGPTAFAFPTRAVFSAGNIVGVQHTSDKAATITASLFGHLEPV